MVDQGFSVEMLDGVPGARLRGELDLGTSDRAAAELRPLFDATGDVTLDLAELSFIDSSGIRLLIRLGGALGDGGRLILRSAQPHVARVLRIAGLPELGVRLEEEGG